MPRYIDADEALRISKEGRFMWAYDLTDLEEFLTNVPSVDAVEVVRCKDCKHCKVASWGEMFCGRKYTEISDLREDDFCSYGERRGEA